MSLFEQVVAEVKPFLGDRSNRFVRIQCENHLHIAPEKLSKDLLPQLSYWMMLSASLILSRDQAEDLEEKIITLIEES